MEHMFEMNLYTQEMDACTDCHGTCAKSCAGACYGSGVKSTWPGH